MELWLTNLRSPSRMDHRILPAVKCLGVYRGRVEQQGTASPPDSPPPCLPPPSSRQLERDPAEAEEEDLLQESTQDFAAALSVRPPNKTLLAKKRDFQGREEPRNCFSTLKKKAC